MEVNYKKIAEEIISKVGKDNIESLSYCATRLRLIVKNREQIKDAEVEKIEGVVGVFYNSGQYQIVLGKNVMPVYDEMVTLGVRPL
ncbi:PTS transporter subunit EIIB [Brachyspira hampsonii]|uniref:PTS sugar transporter subunit IIABC n=1 Tax=Brachyspira hampsonii TaxID=1287055 RepID=A0AAC9XJ87_9SPIR|nr:PTS transporter subunit EIIB [Brachyspira hampsonii]ASJ20502.1 PTS sugar transporter subunit IIABC [Brachyspira hampsonii]ELV05806.1 PTS system transporter subunit IIABC [Brachyspira hampsonii 30599]MBW5411406.1 PTS sugar transporter subunit IIABC [Brachyspira hampsonii]OEJ19383.1 PTS sugar transporter subunit IIABC [Brachyspira hampsonii]